MELYGAKKLTKVRKGISGSYKSAAKIRVTLRMVENPGNLSRDTILEPFHPRYNQPRADFAVEQECLSEKRNNSTF
jgi:hypothetical protein